MTPVCLIVDCDDLARASIARLLQEIDVQTIGASNAAQALQLLERHEVDLVVTEEYLHGPSGTQLLRTIRYRWPRVARVLIGNELGPDVMTRAVNQCGVHRVLSKGMHPVTLRDEVQDALNERWVAANEFHSGRLTIPPISAADLEHAPVRHLRRVGLAGD